MKAEALWSSGFGRLEISWFVEHEAVENCPAVIVDDHLEQGR